MTAIIGAGLSGLIAATQFPQARIFEANGPESVSHKAVLRFRSDQLSRLTGIPFRRVTVRKAIFYAGKHRAPTVELANLYSRKTNGGYLDRSIWNVDAVERFIAPEDLIQQLISMVEARINWNAQLYPDDIGAEPLISTMPMPTLVKMLRARNSAVSLRDDMFSFASIKVDRYRIDGADIYQTVYFPDHSTSVYRASITGSLLIVERVQDWLSRDDTDRYQDENLDMVLRSFGLLALDVKQIEIGHAQRFGKIAPIDDALRRHFIYHSTVHHQVYSLGRFATWRNILLDDVIDDVAIIKRLIAQGSYGAALQHHKNPITEN